MASNTIEQGWTPLGGIKADLLADDRLQLHHAAQLIASFGQTWIEPRPDDSHRGFLWDDPRRSLVGHPTPAGVCARLEVPTLHLSLSKDGSELAELPLRGAPLDTALQWLQSEMVKLGHAGSASWPEYDLPPHAVGSGAPLAPGSAGLGELAAWYHNAWLLLDEVVSHHAPGSPILGWPHHFDLASLIEIGPAVDGRDAMSIGIGFSPGDEATPTPYFYVNTWPYPDSALLPTVEGPGRWQTEGWVGALLDAADLGTGPEQEAVASRFFSERVQGARLALARAEDARIEQGGSS